MALTRNPAASPKPRRGKCRVCHDQFQKTRSIQPTCEKFDCKVTYANRVAAKAEEKRVRETRRADAARRQAMKPRSYWVREAQKAFNAYIRARDAGKPCICCGKPLGTRALGGDYDCGHYRSVGSAPHLRFDERNAHAQRKVCNQFGAGRAVDYRIGLIARIGQEAVEALEADQSVRKYTIEDLKAIIAEYRAKLKQLQVMK